MPKRDHLLAIICSIAMVVIGFLPTSRAVSTFIGVDLTQFSDVKEKFKSNNEKLAFDANAQSGWSKEKLNKKLSEIIDTADVPKEVKSNLKDKISYYQDLDKCVIRVYSYIEKYNRRLSWIIAFLICIILLLGILIIFLKSSWEFSSSASIERSLENISNKISLGTQSPDPSIVESLEQQNSALSNTPLKKKRRK